MKKQDEYQELRDYIHMQNEFARIAGPILEHYKEASKPFIGKKIVTQKGWIAKYGEAINFDRESIEVKPLPHAKWANIQNTYLDVFNNKDLTLQISLCFSDGTTGCTYKKHTFWFAKIENSILVSIDDNVKCDWAPLDFELELSKIKKYRAIEKRAKAAQDDINVPEDIYKYFDFK